MSSNPDNRVEKIAQRNRRGRPSVKKQIEIEEKIWSYFSCSVCPAVASRESKIDRKTINKYYKKFAEHRRAINEDAFNEQCKINVESADIALSYQIMETQRSQQELKRVKSDLLRKKNYSLKDFLSVQGEERRLSKNMAYLIAVKTNLANSMTADVTLSRLAKEQDVKLVD